MVKLCCPYLHSFGHIPRPPAFRRRPDRPAWRSGIECRPVQRVQRLGVCVVPCVVCLAACDVQVVWVRWSRHGCTGGVYSRRPAPPGQPFNHRKNKKDPPHFHKSEPIRLCKSPKIPKNTKRPISEPRLCYNQLKAIRQRKEESK